MQGNAQYEQIEAELQRLLDRLYGADPATVERERHRLRALAGQVQDEKWRRRAIRRADQLPSLLSGPPPATSSAYAEAQRLYAEAVNSTAAPDDRADELVQVMARITDLAARAPVPEAGAIRQLNSSLFRLLTSLRQELR
ncbi:hypothetical protein [Kribbella sp. CA-247076]|uniref:hypothetical protein n=1 Tax=Kribbella sp. CA-247076 TaxID=3239941 RepID=UPI003D910792